MIKRIGIVGYFDNNKNFSDAQATKTISLYNELSNRGFENIFFADILNKTNKLTLLWKTLKCVLSCDVIIFLPSGTQLKEFVPLMYRAKKMFNRRIYHYATGDTLAEYVKSTKSGAYQLGFIDGNWVEYSKMKHQLEGLGITNCEVVPPFKKPFAKKAIPVPTEDGTKRFCMLGKVCAKKEIADIIDAISSYNSNHLPKARLQIWGSIDKEYEDEFHTLLKEHSDTVSYMGHVDFHKNTEAMSDHIALLLPKVLKDESSSLTIIDAYNLALPVIATDSGASLELIRNFETGWVYPNEKAKNLKDSIEWSMEHQDEMIAMRKNCSLFATRFSPDFVVRRLIEKYLKD